MSLATTLTMLALIILVILIYVVVPYLIGRDAKQRGSKHQLAWTLGAFFSFLTGAGVIVFIAFYLVVRDDLHTP